MVCRDVVGMPGSLSDTRLVNQCLEPLISMFRIPVALFDHEENLHAANESIALVASACGLFQLSEGLLQFTDSPNSRFLEEELPPLLLHLKQQEDDLESPILLLPGDDKLRLGLSALRDPNGHYVGCILYMLGHEEIALPAEAQLRQLFQLTRAEGYLCLMFLKGQSVADVASETKRSPHTIREHLKSVFRKTGCHTQAALINTLASVPIKPQ